QQQAVRAGEGDEVRDELGRDRLARLGLALLAGVTVVGDHGRDPSGRGATQRVQDDEQLHQVLVHRRARRLDHEHVVSAHRVLDLDVDLAVGEMAQARIGQLNVEDLGDPGGQLRVGAAGDELELAPGRGLRPGELDRGLKPPYQLGSESESGDFTGFLRTTLAGTPTAVAPSGTSLVTTEPAPVRDSLPSLTGATSIVSTPTNAPSPISVRFLFLPSKLAVIVPAPMFASTPRSVSPRYETCGTLLPRPTLVRTSSAKLPMCTSSATSVPGRSLANGPQSERSPILASSMYTCGPMWHSAPVWVSPLSTVNGSMTVSWPMVTVESMNVHYGSTAVTPSRMRCSSRRRRSTSVAFARSTRSLIPIASAASSSLTTDTGRRWRKMSVR